MPDSIQEQIIKKIALAISEVTTGNGYANTVASVQRHNMLGMDLATVPAVLIREGTCAIDMEKSTYPHVRRRMELFIVIAHRQDEEHDARSGGEILNSLVADIEQRLAASQNWDGLAIMTMPPEYLEVELDAQNPHLTRGMRLETVYQHLRTNPYSQ